MDDMNDLKTAIEKLQAEMEWVKVMLSGNRPSEVPERTSPPWVTTFALIAVPIVTAVIATKPWA